MARIESPVLLLIASALLAACNRSGPPAPFELHTHQGPPRLSEPVPTVHPDRVTVANGDTLYGVSRRYGVPVRAIIDANDLKPPFRLLAGSSLALPQVRTHLVQPGETLASVARQHGVDASTLASTNHLGAPYVIRSGETLVLPAAVEAAVPPSQTAPRAVPREGVAVAALPPAAADASAPSVGPPARLPPPVGSTAPVAAGSVATLSPPNAPPSAAPPLGAVTAAPQTLPEPPPPSAATSAKPAEDSAALATVPAAGKGFLWPVRGRIVAAYGTTAQGTHNDGINIAAPEGTPVLAADAGEIAYAGNELRGYGNLVLVKHANGFITAYGHNETLLVKRGQHVARGQPIAKVGATGAVTEPQLHFEIRRGTRVLDPDDYLPAQTATAR
jgi:murein DD-endopeptidase MepM/ murein hydrolase activator NlpD